MRTLDWYGLYSDSWQGEIVPEAFSHPAKYSRALIRKIYQHMLESGWIKPGDKVIDPFGGVALGAYHAMQNGLVWYGCELEPKFVDLGNQNITLWNGRYSPHFAKWGSAVLIQGDSRNLVKNIQGYADMGLSSPPYAGARIPEPGKAADSMRRSSEFKYGFQPGQLGQFPEGSHDAAISSSPYSASKVAKNSTGINIEKQWETYRNSGGGMSLEKFRIQQEKHSYEYGNENGQLSNLSEGDFEAAVTSPVYAETVKNGEGTGVRYDPNGHKGDNAYKASSQATYGKSNGQLGQMNGSGFEAGR
jgi:hypothetical protein